MKKFKRIMALVIAMAILATMSLSAFAANATPTGNLTPDTEIEVGALDEGDVVTFVKLIKWVPSVGWAWENDTVASAAQTARVNLTTITGYLDTTKDPAEFHEGVISASDGGELAKIAQTLLAGMSDDDKAKLQRTVATGKNAVKYLLSETADDAANITDQEQLDYVGLYVALVKPATADYLYNPIFVAADYNPDSTNTNTIGSSEIADGTLSYSPKSLAKKEKVTLTKTSGTDSDVQYDVKVGDVIPFTIESIIPEFSTSYQEPMYQISDTMSTGLELITNDDTNYPITVKVQDAIKADENAAAPDTTNWQTLSSSGDGSTPADYTFGKKAADGFAIDLGSVYLQSNQAAKKIKVTYFARVTAIDDTNVVKKDNTATVKFSNNPADSSKYSLLEDKTYHYTFSIDANLLGNNKWENSELVKIGLSADGTEIHQSKLSNGTMAGILEGAEFGLYTDDQCKTLYTNGNEGYTVTGKYTSDANGKLNISGLDAGTYYLKEISAPAGYIKSSDVWKIEIIPHYTEVQGGTYTNSDGILVKYDGYQYLDTYSVKVTNTSVTPNAVVNSSFTITNTGIEKKSATNSTPDSTTKLNNTQGTELPSTGGIGTTIFYVVGALLVIGAGVVLITRRRMDA